MMLKQSTTEEDLKIYELYIQRSTTEGEWIWLRFNIYFGFNAGAFVIVGLALQPFLNVFLTPLHVTIIATFLCVLGIVFSVLWLMSIRDSARWQEVIFDTICKIEERIFDTENRDIELYVNMQSELKSGEAFRRFNQIDEIGKIINKLNIKSMDVMVVNSYTATGSLLGWIIILFIVWTPYVINLLTNKHV